jgi:hypothetical protein
MAAAVLVRWLDSRSMRSLGVRRSVKVLEQRPQPTPNEERQVFDEDALRQQVEQQYALIYDVLGEGTLTAWHDDCRYAASA